MRTKIFALLLLLSTLPLGKAWLGCCFAQNEQQIIDKLEKATSQMKSLQCDFLQTKTSHMMNKKIQSQGKLYYQKSDKLHWEYTSPQNFAFIMNGNKVAMKQGASKTVLDVKQNKIFKELSKVMMNAVTGKALADKKTFSVSCSETAQSYVCTLLPLRQEMKQVSSKIVLTFSKSSNMLTSIQLYEKKGDVTEIQLSNVSINKKINTSVFAI